MFVDRPRRRSKHPDPFRLADIAAASGAGAALLVAPPTMSPKTALPGALVGGAAAGVVFANRPGELAPWLAGHHRRPGQFLVLFSVIETYERAASRFIRCLRRGGAGRIVNAGADRMDRDMLLAKLDAPAASSLVYFGHGNSRGLCSYTEIHWKHVEAATDPGCAAAFLCFSCETLGRRGAAAPFGVRWVMSGRAAAFFGAVAPVSTDANRTLSGSVATVLAGSKRVALGDMIRRAAAGTDNVAATLRHYRIVGNPLQPVAPL